MVSPALAGIPPPDTPSARWARKNIPGADRPGISASELADLCYEEAMRLLRGEPPPTDGPKSGPSKPPKANQEGKP